MTLTVGNSAFGPGGGEFASSASAGRARHSGYVSALGKTDLPMDPDLVVKTQLTREHGYAAARELLSRPDRPHRRVHRERHAGARRLPGRA
ncbi:hypothetical protein ACIHCQ_27665 [Streptomyces sp. NPDC052236]|uniref:hypothetical protein n=1 Tax=Streptomyces sp. NPDC052236 TaxID=3365686 RepID=UPI0037CEC39B